MKRLDIHSSNKIRLLVIIRERTERMKRIICDYLNQISQGWSRKTLRMYCIFFILVGTGVSLDIGAQAVLHRSTTVFERVTHGIISVPYLKDNNKAVSKDNAIVRMRAYQYLLDSLASNDSFQYRKFMEKYPNLRDSLSKLIIILSNHIK